MFEKTFEAMRILLLLFHCVFMISIVLIVYLHLISIYPNNFQLFLHWRNLLKRVNWFFPIFLKNNKFMHQILIVL